MWGWTGKEVQEELRQRGIPTRVGMDRRRWTRGRARPRNPHACGDEPKYRSYWESQAGESPRVWGWTVTDEQLGGLGFGIPTRVGMDRRRHGGSACGAWNPHACGDGPCCGSGLFGLATESPRVWGWTVAGELEVLAGAGIPTRVGMDRSRTGCRTRPGRNPHACGDGPPGSRRRHGRKPESPRVWGWTVGVRQVGVLLVGIPTRVGMDRD